MYDYYDDDLDELLEEAYLEGYYDGYEDDYDYYSEKRAVDKMYINNLDTLAAANTARMGAGEKYAKTSWMSPIKKLKARNAYNKADKNSIDAMYDVWGVAGPIGKSNAVKIYRGLKGQAIDSEDIEAAKNFKKKYGGSGNDGTHKPLSQMTPKERKAYKEELLAKKAAREKAKEDEKAWADKKAALARKDRNFKIGVGVGTVAAGGIGYGIYRHNKKKKEILEELKDPRFRRQHPELVDKYRKALIKQGIIKEAAGYYYDDYDDFDIIDTDYYEVY